MFDFPRWAEPLREELRGKDERLAAEAHLQLRDYPQAQGILQTGPDYPPGRRVSNTLSRREC